MMNSTWNSLVPNALIAMALVAANPDDTSKKDIERMQGEWQLVSMVRDGQEQPDSELNKMIRRVVGNELILIVEAAEGVVTLKSTFTIDATTDPKEIDVTRSDGPTKGQTGLGIYKFDGDRLTTCAVPAGKARPTEFLSTAGSGQVLYVWKRVKADANTSSNRLDRKAVQLIEQVGRLVQNAKSIRADGTVVTTGDADGRAPIKIQTTWAMDTPNRFKLRARHADNANAGTDLICDGQHLFVHVLGQKEYTERPAVHELAEIGEALAPLGRPNVGILFRNLLTEDASEALMFGVNSCVYAGIERIDDKPAHYLKFTQDDFNWELWVAAEGKPVVLKMRSIFSLGERRVTILETYKNWQIDGQLPADTFQFMPPEDAKKVERFSQATP